MLVALQVARSGNLPPAGASQPDSQTSSSTITHGGTKLSLEVWCTCFVFDYDRVALIWELVVRTIFKVKEKSCLFKSRSQGNWSMGIFHRARTFPLKWDLSSVGRFRPGGSYFRKICCLYPPFFDYLFLLRTIFVCILPAFVQPSFAVPLCRIRSLLPNRCLFLLSHAFLLRKRWMRQGVLRDKTK